MTDIERNKVFEAKKQETIDRLLGNSKFDETEETVDHFVDVNWNRGKPWQNDVRINSNQNARNTLDQTYYQFALRDNGGVVVTVSDETLSEEAPVVKWFMIVKYWWTDHTSSIDNFSILKTNDNECILYGLNDKLKKNFKFG